MPTSDPAVRLNYCELAVGDTTVSRSFYEQAFGWTFTDFAPTYSATTSDDTDIGLDADSDAPPLPVCESDDLAATLARVEAAGGTVVKAIFAFPGGHRFHFVDPDGNELAVWQRD